MISVVHFQIHNDSLLLLYSTSHHTQIQTIFVCRHFTFLLLFILVSLIFVGFFYLSLSLVSFNEFQMNFRFNFRLSELKNLYTNLCPNNSDLDKKSFPL